MLAFIINRSLEGKSGSTKYNQSIRRGEEASDSYSVCDHKKEPTLMMSLESFPKGQGSPGQVVLIKAAVTASGGAQAGRSPG